MKIKYAIMFLPILMCTSLFSIGFASWVIGNSPEVLKGNINTEEVFSARVYFELVDIEELQYCTEGYVYNNSITNTGYMTLHYRVNNVNNFDELFAGKYNSINVQFKMTFNSTSYNIFKSTSTQSSSHQIISNQLSVSDKYPTGKLNNEYIFDLTINYLDLVEEETYDLALKFEFKYTGNDFTTIYNELKNLGNNAFTIDTVVVGIANQNMSGGDINA